MPYFCVYVETAVHIIPFGKIAFAPFPTYTETLGPN
jgi:hypothetical protein